MKINILILATIIIFITFDLFADNRKNIRTIRRDPFVVLVNRDGTIRSVEDLFRSLDETLPIKIELKGILWGKRYPLAIINDKVFKEGSEIAEGVILEKINESNVVLNYQGKKLVTELRKKEEE